MEVGTFLPLEGKGILSLGRGTVAIPFPRFSLYHFNSHCFSLGEIDEPTLFGKGIDLLICLIIKMMLLVAHSEREGEIMTSIRIKSIYFSL